MLYQERGSSTSNFCIPKSFLNKLDDREQKPPTISDGSWCQQYLFDRYSLCYQCKRYHCAPPPEGNPSQRMSYYTLFSAYGCNANGSMFPIAFAIMFGNKNKECLSKFWNFVTNTHPCLNLPEVTYITDQDKGSIAAISQYLPNVHHFHCSW